MHQPDRRSAHAENVAQMRPRIAHLARLLGPSLGVVGAATRTEAGLRAWVDAWAALAAAAGLTDDEIRRGVASLDQAPRNKPFGWDVFVALCRPPDAPDARRELDALCTAYARREFAALDGATWQAGWALGIARCFHQDGITPAAWASALAEARRAPDAAVLARQPRAGQCAIGMSDDARQESLRRRAAACEAALASLPAHLRPRRFQGLEPPN